jgi:hypothetical protein
MRVEHDAATQHFHDAGKEKGAALQRRLISGAQEFR